MFRKHNSLCNESSTMVTTTPITMTTKTMGQGTWWKELLLLPMPGRGGTVSYTTSHQHHVAPSPQAPPQPPTTTTTVYTKTDSSPASCIHCTLQPPPQCPTICMPQSTTTALLLPTPAMPSTNHHRLSGGCERKLVMMSASVLMQV